MSYYQQPHGYQQPYGQQPPRRKRRSCLTSCLLALTTFVFVLLLLAVGALVFIRPQISEFAGQMIGTQLEAQINQKIGDAAGGAGEIPAEFVGTVVVTDAELNDYIAQNPQEIAPLEQATVQFSPGLVTANFSAYGLSGTATSGLTVENGRIEAVDPQMSGPLRFVLDVNQLADSLETQLNSQFAADGKQISDIVIGDGIIEATVE